MKRRCSNWNRVRVIAAGAAVAGGSPPAGPVITWIDEGTSQPTFSADAGETICDWTLESGPPGTTLNGTNESATYSPQFLAEPEGLYQFRAVPTNESEPTSDVYVWYVEDFTDLALPVTWLSLTAFPALGTPDVPTVTSVTTSSIGVSTPLSTGAVRVDYYVVISGNTSSYIEYQGTAANPSTATITESSDTTYEIYATGIEAATGRRSLPSGALEQRIPADNSVTWDGGSNSYAGPPNRQLVTGGGGWEQTSGPTNLESQIEGNSFNLDFNSSSANPGLYVFTADPDSEYGLEPIPVSIWFNGDVAGEFHSTDCTWVSLSALSQITAPAAPVISNEYTTGADFSVDITGTGGTSAVASIAVAVFVSGSTANPSLGSFMGLEVDTGYNAKAAAVDGTGRVGLASGETPFSTLPE